MATTFNRKFVEEWAARYDYGKPEDEERLFGEVSRRTRKAGHYTKDDLIAVGRWKSSRSAGRLRANSESEVREVTTLAMQASDEVGYRLLSVLRGVGVPVASALLTVALPERYTIIDVRAVRSLRRLGLLPKGKGSPSYPEYLAACRSAAEKAKVNLRTLDKALWKFDQKIHSGK